MHCRFLAAILGVVLSIQAGEARTAPDWLHEVSRLSDLDLEAGAAACILLNSTTMAYSARGECTTSRKYAIRINTHEGNRRAVFEHALDSADARMSNLRIYILRKGGRFEGFRKKDCLEVSKTKVLYTERKKIIFDASERVENGDVFAFEYSVKEPTIFPMKITQVQKEVPQYRFMVRVRAPKGWSVDSITLNGDGLKPKQVQSDWVWEGRNLVGLGDKEKFMPRWYEFSPFLIVSIVPPEGYRGSSPYLHLKDWNAIAAYASSVLDPPAAGTSPVTNKANSLAAGTTSSWESIEAVAKFIQSLNYVSIEMDLSAGGGYRPYESAEVLKRGYGDCKDLTTLMRALLTELGIPNYAVLTSIGNARPPFADDWPSVNWFNHCIVGIDHSGDSPYGPNVHHPQLGGLVIFDPTDKFTPLGEMSPALYGSPILVVDDSSKTYAEIPVPPETSNLVTSEVSLYFAQTGVLKARVHLEMRGLIGHFMLNKARSNTLTAFDNYLLEFLGTGLSQLTIDDLNWTAPRQGVDLDLDASIQGHARFTGNRLIMFKPLLFFRGNSIPPPDKRRNPVLIKSRQLQERVEFEIPEGFVVEETPADLQIEEIFGTYAARCWTKEGTFIIERKLLLKESVLPPESYQLVRAFYRRLTGFENTPIVLARSN